MKLEFKLNLYRVEYGGFSFAAKIKLASKIAVVSKFNRTCCRSCSSSHHLDTRCSRLCSACIHHILINQLGSYTIPKLQVNTSFNNERMLAPKFGKPTSLLELVSEAPLPAKCSFLSEHSLF